MKIHNGGLMAYLNKQTTAANVKQEGVPGKDNIVWLDVRELVRNEKNFYGIRDIEELASMIAASGTIEPITVTPDRSGKYRIVAGERRTAATLLRLERGDLIDPKVPCMVKEFHHSGALSPEDMEMLCLIVSNRGQRQTRTALEKLREIEELEPIAQKIFKDEQIQGTFRRFFAQDILAMSQTKLQRLKTLARLVDEGRAALEIGMLSETAAMELATYSADAQDKYLKALVENNIKNRVEDIRAFFSEEISDEEESSDDFTEDFNGAESSSIDSCQKDNNEADEAKVDVYEDGPPPALAKSSRTADSSRTAKNLQEKGKYTEAIIRVDVPFPEDLSEDKAAREADAWMESILSESIKIAETKIEESRAIGDKHAAALWDSRRAKAVLVLETVRD